MASLCGSAWIIQCIRKVAVHLGYSRVQLKWDGTQWCTGGEVQKGAVHLGYKRFQLKWDGTWWCTGGEVWKVAVHLGYKRFQLKWDGTWWRRGGEVWKVAVHLQKVLEVMPMSIYTDLNLFNFIRKHSSSGLCCSVSAQRLSERSVFVTHHLMTIPKLWPQY